MLAHKSSVKKLPFIEILITELLGSQAEHDATIGAYDVLDVLATAADVGKIAAAPDGLHDGEQDGHDLGADPLSITIDGTAVGAGVFVAHLLAVAAVALGMVTAQEACDLDLKFVLFVIPFFHNEPPKVKYSDVK